MKRNKLTAKKRLNIYLELRKHYEDPKNSSAFTDVKQFHIESQSHANGKFYNFCDALEKLEKHSKVAVEDLPELTAQKPKFGWKKRPDFWWSPFSPERRLKAISDAIVMVEKLIKKGQA